VRSTLLAIAVFATLAAGQEIWAPKAQPGIYTPPHKPHTKLSDLRAKHAGSAHWRELIVNDEHLRSEYLQLAPGTKTPRALHPDTRTWWVVMDGQVRFYIEGQEPFIATKGSMVQAPMQTFFSMEAQGRQPALVFETNIAGAKTMYENETDAPKIPGFDWIPVKFQRRPGEYGRNNKPHVTFDELARKLESGELKGTVRVVEDDRGAANFIYGYEKNLPRVNSKDRGHYHPECAEYWLIMKGEIRYPVETQGVIIASEGDIVYVPRSTFHAPRWHGAGPSCRLAMNGYPYIAHLFEAEAPK
jgi:mannose-6-phosphate isomerase-like protein (cupin superfamily)